MRRQLGWSSFSWSLSVGPWSNVKNLLLNFPEPTSLSQAISQAVHCDNRLFEFRQEEHQTWFLVQPQVSLPPAASHSPTMADAPVPMEIDQARFRPWTDAERQFRRANSLCMYCGTSGHVVRHCPQSNRPQFHRAMDPNIRKMTSFGCSRSHATERFLSLKCIIYFIINVYCA